MRLALQAAVLAGQEIWWARSRILRSDRDKCFVLIQNTLPFGSSPVGYRMYAIFPETGQVDDLGDWVFHWGVCPEHAIDRYERCRDKGCRRSGGFAQWAAPG
jgi:hypothetical protein